MGFGLIVSFLQVFLKITSWLHSVGIIKNRKDLEAIQKRVQQAIQKAEGDALDSVDLRKQHEENLEELERLWEKKWGGDLGIPPIVSGSIVAPDQVQVSKQFTVSLKEVPRHTALYADKKWILGYTIKDTNDDLKVILNTVGKRELGIKSGNGWITKTVLVVEE